MRLEGTTQHTIQREARATGQWCTGNQLCSPKGAGGIGRGKGRFSGSAVVAFAWKVKSRPPLPRRKRLAYSLSPAVIAARHTHNGYLTSRCCFETTEAC